MNKISRRGLVRGLIAGAIVLGFNPTSRSWVTEARAGGGPGGLPPLDGVLSTDPAALAAAADDFGNMVHRTPVAVLYPGSVNDVVKMMKFARANGLRVSGRGKGHTPFGQCQADAGLVIDMTTLDTIHSITADRADVDAGVVWRDLLLATTEKGLTPPVLTDYTALTVAGTLSVGGVSGTSHRHGAQIDNVIELQVVTGEGQLVTCSAWQNADLFGAALAGLGQCAIIVRATVALVPAGQNARTFRIFYDDVPTMLADIRELMRQESDHPGWCQGGRAGIDHIRGNASPTATGWSFYIEATSFYSVPENPSAADLLSNLDYLPGSLQIVDGTYFDYCDTVYQLFQELDALGLSGLPHPWLDLFVPGSCAESFTANTVAGLDPAGFLPGSLIAFYPFRRDRLTRPLFRVPDEETFFLFDILRTAAPDPVVVSTILQNNRALYDQNVGQGGTHYVISAVALAPPDWKRHYGSMWGFLGAAKRSYDPSNVLGPGPDIFS